MSGVQPVAEASPQGNGLTEPTGLVTSSRSSRSRSKGSPAYGSLLGTDNNSDTADVLGHHSDTMGGIIDGRFSYGDEGYVTVERPSDDSHHMTQALERCKRTVLSPYLFLLKLLGWRRFRASSHDLEQPSSIKIINFVYPTTFFLLLLYTMIAQISTCFLRTVIKNPTNAITCTDKLLSAELLPDFLLLGAYLWGVYVFRCREPEHLSSMMETVFLSYSTQHVKAGQKKLIALLRLFLVLGVVWIAIFTVTNIGRMYSLQLLNSNATIVWYHGKYFGSTTNLATRYIFVSSALVGFVFFDLFYASVVINYCTQCQLIVFFIRSIMDRVRTKTHTLEVAIKDIRHTYEFIQSLNGQLATIVSLCLYVQVTGLIASSKSIENTNPPYTPLNIVIAICNVVQWSTVIILPILQAARVTRACCRLRRHWIHSFSTPMPQSTLPNWWEFQST
ncbi:hypothetical protein EMCRGX_G025208 [Ephydatia muelleri]